MPVIDIQITVMPDRWKSFDVVGKAELRISLPDEVLAKVERCGSMVGYVTNDLMETAIRDMLEKNAPAEAEAEEAED